MDTPNSSIDECRRIVLLALPQIATFLASFGTQTISILFISHLGALDLAAAVLSQSIFNITGFSLLIGFSGAIDTICGQAYGAKNYHMLGLVLQRGVLLTCLMSVPIIAAWTQIAPLIEYLGQSPEIVPTATKYLLWNSPQLVLNTASACIGKFQTTQNIMLPSTLVNVVLLILSPLFFATFTHWLPWGLKGVAVANNVVSVLELIAMLGTLVWIQRRREPDDPQREAWSGFSWDAWTEWGEYFALGAPSCAMMCLEWWLFEIASMLAGLLPNPQLGLAVTGVCVQIISLAFMVPLGVSSALRIRVSNLLGAGKAQAARRAVSIAVALSMSFTSVYFLVLLLGRGSIRRTFLPYASPQSAEAMALSDCLLLIAIGAVGDWTNCTLGGALQGAGRQNTGAQIYAVTHWLQGGFLLWLFAFRLQWGTRGIWAALAVVSNTQCLGMLFAVCRIDWEHEARRASLLVAAHSRTNVAAAGTENSSVEAPEAASVPLGSETDAVLMDALNEPLLP